MQTKKAYMCNFSQFEKFRCTYTMLCEYIGRFKTTKLRCIAQNTECYVSFSLGNLRFIYSFMFLPSSLETLVSNLAKDGLKAFPYFSSEFTTQTETQLLLCKGVYPYDYMDSAEKFKETALPPKEAFYSNVSKEYVSVEDYKHAQNVYHTFKFNNLGEYHDLDLKSDVGLLCDVFEAFRNVCMEQYNLDPGLS